MAKNFDIPLFYSSPLISTIKSARRIQDHYKKDLAPSVVDLGRVRFKIARHFGFCYGVENAIDITYRAIKENPDKRVFLLSEMIHNAHVNADLMARGVRFLMKTNGEHLIPFDELKSDDIVIVPAFGTTAEIFQRLREIGIDPQVYNATCPFVEKVWKRSSQLGEKGYAVIIHGKHYHEETRATFSHANKAAPSLIIRDIEEAKILAEYIRHERPFEKFEEDFPGRASNNFSPAEHLRRIGVVNQTTMLATETQQISDLLKEAIREYHGEESPREHFADTRDTLCYATNENQDAMYRLIESGGDIAIIVGGYNSSNTSHLVELCEGKIPAYYVKDADEILDGETIRHLDLNRHEVVVSRDWLPEKRPLEVLMTAGASCPDALVDQVLARIASILGAHEEIEKAMEPYRELTAAQAQTADD